LNHPVGTDQERLRLGDAPSRTGKQRARGEQPARDAPALHLAFGSTCVEPFRSIGTISKLSSTTGAFVLLYAVCVTFPGS
jgi:hypothetical protein